MAKSPKKAVAEASLQLPPDYLLCAQSAQKPIVLPDGLSSPRAEAIRVSAKKWLNGTVLHYCFIDNRALPKWTWVENQKKIVRAGFDIWRGVGIGLSFVEVQDASEAEITIGCLQRDGSWSLVGVDNIPPSYRNLGRTMNFGWDLTTPWGKATAIHEIGHALGFSHEHQNPKSGIVWDEDEVYRSFSGPPNNWDRQKIFHNILKKLESSDTEGSDWNPDSIMEYPFAPGLIREPKPYDTKGVGQNFELSASDKAWVKRWYPVSAAPAAISVMQLEHWMPQQAHRATMHSNRQRHAITRSRHSGRLTAASSYSKSEMTSHDISCRRTIPATKETCPSSPNWSKAEATSSE